MKVIATLASKGGAGKTTTTLTVATTVAEMGVAVRILDTDPQGTAARWGDRRGRMPEVHSLHAIRLQAALAEAERDNIELVVIDTPPRADSDALAAARACDLAIMPCLPAIADVEAMQTTLDLIVVTQKEPVSFVLLNAVPARGSEVKETEEVIKNLRDFAQFVPVRLGYRKEFRRCQLTGEGVVETEPSGKAAEEARALATWVLKQLGIVPRRKRKRAA